MFPYCYSLFVQEYLLSIHYMPDPEQGTGKYKVNKTEIPALIET